MIRSYVMKWKKRSISQFIENCIRENFMQLSRRVDNYRNVALALQLKLEGDFKFVEDCLPTFRMEKGWYLAWWNGWIRLVLSDEFIPSLTLHDSSVNEFQCAQEKVFCNRRTVIKHLLSPEWRQSIHESNYDALILGIAADWLEEQGYDARILRPKIFDSPLATDRPIH
jgi:hypothetical protein